MTSSLRRGITALIRTTTSADNPPAGQRSLIPKADGWYDRTAGGVETNLNLGIESGTSLPSAGTPGRLFVLIP